MSDLAHDYAAAYRVYSAMDTGDLQLVAKALRDDAKTAKHYATSWFAIERLTLIVDILAERLVTAKRKTRKIELALEKTRPPEVKLEKVD